MTFDNAIYDYSKSVLVTPKNPKEGDLITVTIKTPKKKGATIHWMHGGTGTTPKDISTPLQGSSIVDDKGNITIKIQTIKDALLESGENLSIFLFEDNNYSQYLGDTGYIKYADSLFKRGNSLIATGVWNYRFDIAKRDPTSLPTSGAFIDAAYEFKTRSNKNFFFLNFESAVLGSNMALKWSYFGELLPYQFKRNSSSPSDKITNPEKYITVKNLHWSIFEDSNKNKKFDSDDKFIGSFANGKDGMHQSNNYPNGSGTFSYDSNNNLFFFDGSGKIIGGETIDTQAKIFI